jgi:hypothetical protein
MHIVADEIVDHSRRVPQFMEKVRARLDIMPRGTKSKLAKFLGVDAVTLTRWLDSKAVPDGTATLALVDWVEHGFPPKEKWVRGRRVVAYPVGDE